MSFERKYKQIQEYVCVIIDLYKYCLYFGPGTFLEIKQEVSIQATVFLFSTGWTRNVRLSKQNLEDFLSSFD